jgi:hypothetical protein
MFKMDESLLIVKLTPTPNLHLKLVQLNISPFFKFPKMLN